MKLNYEEIARAAIERHLGDVVGEDSSIDALYDEAFVLAHDALRAAGLTPQEATPIAQQEAQKVAQP